jgi:hypothetical protein
MDGSCWSTFEHGDVSAHFWVAQSGLIEQYVDSETVAWHAMQMNDTYCGVETEGCSAPPYADPMSDAMVASLGRLYAEGMRRHGWPAVLANADGEPGFGYHRMGVATACPCDVRLARRPEILDAATGGATVGPPAIDESEGSMVLHDAVSGGVWVTDRTGAVFAYDGAPYLGGINAPDHTPGGEPCVGIADDGAGGYVLVADFGDAGGDRFRRYHYSRR